MSAKKKDDDSQGSRGYVPVIYARNITEAEFYKGLLETNDIPAIIEDAASEVLGIPESIVGKGVPVLVPDGMLDEASEILAEHGDSQEEEALDDYEEMDEEFEDDAEEVDDEELDEDFDDDDLDDDFDDDMDDDEIEEFDDDDDDEFVEEDEER